MDKTEFTRQEIYDLVWSKPFSSLAKIYEISDTGLRKICNKYEIPFPKTGHWQKVQFGKKVEREKLVLSDKWTETKITLSDREASEKDHYLTRLARLTKVIEKEHPSLLEIPERLTKPDSLIDQAKAYFNSKESTSHWRYSSEVHTKSGLLSIAVAKDNVPRALRFMDAFIKLGRKRGHQIEISSHDTLFIVDDERYKIRFREQHIRQIVQTGTWTRSELIPNGILSLKLDNLYPKEWKDGKILLEKQLAKIMAAFEIRAEDDKIERARREAYWAEQERLDEIRKKEAAIKAWELKKVDILLKHSKKWNQAKKLSSFIAEIEKRNNSSNEKITDWIKWAKGRLDKLDPISNGLDTFLKKYEYSDD